MNKDCVTKSQHAKLTDYLLIDKTDKAHLLRDEGYICNLLIEISFISPKHQKVTK